MRPLKWGDTGESRPGDKPGSNPRRGMLLSGEPDTWKLVCPVRRGAWGNLSKDKAPRAYPTLPRGKALRPYPTTDTVSSTCGEKTRFPMFGSGLAVGKRYGNQVVRPQRGAGRAVRQRS
jgi:hypothetical protein